MGYFLKFIFMLGLFFALPTFGEGDPHCDKAKRGNHGDGKYASLLRCVENGNCPTHHRRRTPTKKKKVKKPQGEASGSH